MKKAGGDLRIANATDKIESLLVVTKLITVFKHFRSVDEAVESYKSLILLAIHQRLKGYSYLRLFFFYFY